MKTTRQTGPDRRHSLLQAALDLFSTQGYDGTTTRAIAERSGVTEAILFRHFRTKQELLRAVVEEFGPRRVFSPPPETLSALPFRAALEEFITLYLDTFWENRAFMRMVFTTPKQDQAPFAELWEEFTRQAIFLYTLVQQRSDNQELRAEVAAAVTDIVSTSTGGFLMRVLNDEPADWNQARTVYLANLTEIVLHGVLKK